LPEVLVGVLADHLREYPTTDLVFGLIHPSNFRQPVWNPAVAASVGRPRRFHDLRHSHATR
jgi:integrase